MQEFLQEIGIEGQLIESEDHSFILELEDSIEYGKVYSRLDRSDLVDEIEDSSQLTSITSAVQFESDEYLITLLANFETDEYKLVIRNKDN